MDEKEETLESTNFVSLFERSTLSGWDASLPAAEASKESGWSSLRPSQLFRLFGAKVLPESLLYIVEQSLRWKVAYSTVHYALAIQKDGRLEIWRDYCSVPVSKSRILDDDHPQWCKLQWSASGNLLLSARSTHAVDAFDTTGAFCFSIPLPSSDGTFNPLYCVASIASAPHTTDTVWSDRIWILQYDGNMRCYLAGRVSGYHPLSSINVSGGASSIAITAALLPRANTMLVSSFDPDLIHPASEEKAMASRGVSIWRITDAEPYLERFGHEANTLEAKPNAQKKSFTLFQSSKEYVLRIVVNSDETFAACLTSRGDVMAFRIPSLQAIKSWSLGDELSPRRENASFITGIGWWSHKELMLLYSTGFVATVNFDSDGTTAAVEKNYSPWAELICASQGHVLILEITGRPEKPAAKGRSLTSFIRPLIRLPYSLLKMAGRAFVGAPLTGTDTNENQVEMLPCRYILHEMKAITPPELFKKKLIASSYDEALAVAETYCLNADRVYQEQWKKNPITVETIDNFLVKVKQRKWVIDECVTQIPESFEACKKLLDLGLKLTEDLSKLAGEKDIKTKQQECAARYRLVHYRRILDDYEAMLNATSGQTAQFDSKRYGQVRNLTVYEWGLKLARAADFLRLGVLFERYGRRIFPIWLPLLNNVPETMDFMEYDHLLPKSKQRPDWAEKQSEQKPDFIEDSRFAPIVEIKKDDIESVTKDKPALKDFILSIDRKAADDVPIIRKWYEFRALEIEKFACLPDLAEKFLKLASANGFTDLDALCEDMGLLALLNYECSLSTSVSYERLKKMQPLETLHLLLKESPKDVFVKRFEQWAVPFCVRWEQRHQSPAKTLVWKYVVASSEESLKIPLLLCQSFKTKFQWWSELIGLTSSDIVRMVSDCLAACGDPNQIDAGFQLISYIPQLSKGDPDAAIVQSMENHLTALHLLNVYGIALSYQKLQSIAASEQESAMLLKRLVRHGTSAVATSTTTTTPTPPQKATPSSTNVQKDQAGTGTRMWSTDDWRTLLKDMMQISRTVLPTIGEQRCHELFVDGLLSSKSMNLIDLAAKFLTTTRDGTAPKKGPTMEKAPEQPRLSYDSAVDLIAQAAEAYVNEAEDARDESLNYARKCLSLLENPPDKLVREREFIDALPLLEHFDVRDVPARLRLYKNPVRLVEEVFMRKSTAYDEYEKLLRLCKLLRVPIADRNEPNSLLIMCARQSLMRKDAAACVKFCREIVASNCSSGWRVCWDACNELCTTPSFNADIRQRLLVFCLSHCDAAHLEPILNSLRGLKAEQLKKDFDLKAKTRMDEGPWLTSLWNEIKSQDEPDPVSEWRTDPIYLDATDYDTDNEAQSISEQGATLINFLRYLLLTEEADATMLDQVQAAIGAHTMAAQTYYAMATLIGVKNDEVCEKALRTIPPSPLVTELAMYVHTIRAAIKAGVDGMDLKALMRVEPIEVIRELFPALGAPENGRVKAWTATVVEFPEGVDRDRFAKDEQYRKETIVGLALTDDEVAYNKGLHLADIYGVSTWEVSMSHLEFLFTESGMDASTLSELIKSRRLLEKLSEHREDSHERLKSNVFPLLNGKDHSILQLYYAVDSKVAIESELTTVNAHRANLKQLKQIGGDVDYKRLISNENDVLDLLIPYMTAENFTAFAKVATKIPGKNYTLEDVLCVWARKVFIETVQKATVPISFERCKKVLEKLNAETYERFVEKSMDRLSSDTVKLEFVRLAIEFAKEREKLSACMEQLKEWESFLA